MAASDPSTNGRPSSTGAKTKRRRKKKPAGRPEGRPEVRYVSLAEETRRRYLNYALSVISSRALPDARDGLKPVQRRILYVMGRDLNLAPGGKPAKCARIVGDTIGKYHPHGNAAAYDTLVRMAQDHSLRVPLVDGQGNFGSVLGFPAAAERYTEARLTAPAASLMAELGKNTVPTRPTYDADRTEPVVFPAAFPHLLVNGATGIAVGMATNVPPHNLREVVNSARALIDDPEISVAQLMQKGIRGPDFPLGGRIVSDRADIRTAYEEGRGSIKVRAVWDFDPEDETRKGRKKGRPARLVVDSLPYGVTSNALVGGAEGPRGEPQDPPTARRRRRDRPRARPADHADDQGQGRRRDGDGVPLQAHRAGAELRRQSDGAGARGDRRSDRPGRGKPPRKRPQRLYSPCSACSPCSRRRGIRRRGIGR